MNHDLEPDYEFVAYIDESGDPSLKRVRPIDVVGGTEWFILSAVLVRRDRDAEAVGWVSSINRQFGSVNDQVIHFKDLEDDNKIIASKLIANLPIRIFVVASNKKNMRGYRNIRAEQFNRQQWFYNWMFRILAERITDYCLRFVRDKALARKHVKFVFSKTGGHSYSQTAAYTELMKHQARGGKMILQKHVPRWEVMSWKLVESYPHYKRAGLQIADVAASAFYHAVDNIDTGPCNTSYAEALETRVAFNENGRAGYGLVLQPTPEWDVAIGEDQRAIFRFYGYDFIKKW